VATNHCSQNAHRYRVLRHCNHLRCTIKYIPKVLLGIKMQLRGGKVKKGIVLVKATNQSKPSAPKPKSRKYKKNKSKKYLLNNFMEARRRYYL
jgi:hypothetical protein